ncbi:LOW QUALITY PROTEIN: solute carrier family 35 member C2 [Erythrolamprus reginae]|uniref:LOW QUALITY PROTEIN: solute carrier family 35 member C2 n=1 Tax=Erythrolamprus reginae TaxID=121349 RepID=UPI00396CE3E8
MAGGAGLGALAARPLWCGAASARAMAGARGAARAAGLVLLYYGFSIGITFYNKWLMKSFAFPLFMTLLHLLVIFALSGLARRCSRRCCPAAPGRALLPWAAYLRQVAPTALSTALDVGLSNWSFLYITVSLYTMTKSSAVLFILLFSLVFKLEEPRAALVLVVVLIAGGLFLFTYEATQFDAQGFAMVLGASFLGGLRWTRTQILLQKDELGLQNPIDTMFHLQPPMFLSLFPLFAVFEGLPLSASEKLFRCQEGPRLLRLLGKLALGGVLAFGLAFSEFLLVSRTSSLTFSISGIFKEVFTLVLAAHLMGDQLLPGQLAGLLRLPRGHLSARGPEGPRGAKGQQAARGDPPLLRTWNFCCCRTPRTRRRRGPRTPLCTDPPLGGCWGPRGEGEAGQEGCLWGEGLGPPEWLGQKPSVRACGGPPPTRAELPSVPPSNCLLGMGAARTPCGRDCVEGPEEGGLPLSPCGPWRETLPALWPQGPLCQAEEGEEGEDWPAWEGGAGGGLNLGAVMPMNPHPPPPEWQGLRGGAWLGSSPTAAISGTQRTRDPPSRPKGGGIKSGTAIRPQ